MSRGQEFVKGVWKQEPLIHTPKELTHIAKSLTSKDHPELGGEHGATGNLNDPNNNQLAYMGGNKESAAGECDRACRYAHDHLPHGSHVVEYRRDHTGKNEFANHYVHHVPTTEGMYAVDYTQRQFNAKAKFPVVEKMGKFQNRKSMSKFDTMHSDRVDLYRADKEGNIYPEQ
jgi:hypothetical protein